MRTAIKYRRRIPLTDRWDIHSAGPTHRIDPYNPLWTICGQRINTNLGWEVLPGLENVACVNCIKKLKRDE